MYQALYRQYRPKTFDEVLGQEHITTTLKNQIVSENIGHAYLFAGTKGTGKTSTAKIFSRAVNCLNPIDGNPCNECAICKGILDESMMDVIEMDAASNRKIEDIREIRDKVIYPPSKAKYKIYIIDEVHMLTNQAFNALLKTLEEPPKHLIFILATTDLQKLPQTILSRCQRFDFKRITSKDIIINMRKITSELDIKVDEKVLQLIARNSDGAMRDALSLLEQCISYKSEELTYVDALNILGIANTDLIFSMVDNIKNKKIEDSLLKVDQIIQEGKDINQFIKDLIYHFRNLLIVKTSNNSVDIMDMDEETISKYKKQSEDISLDFILKSLDILNKSENQAKWATQPRIILEMTIIKLINLEDQASLEDRIKKLEMAIDNGKLPIAKPISTANKPKNKVSKKMQQSKPKEQKLEQEKQKEIEPVEIVDDGKELPFENIKVHWDTILKIVKEKDIKTNAFLREGKLVSFSNNNLVLGYNDGFGFHKEAMERPQNKELVEQIVSSHFNKNIKLKFIMIDGKMEDDTEKNEDKIKEVIDFFGEDIVEIE
ncbi:DNA polymerase III subunit gamma/tau [Schnuerera sp. xch1]|uniref:DNA polymerase III subunit gamma/tau n=1 Tax=Schnuerera sp. xch1 TaxID=2874283 RepID=UPI001CBD2E99|nr:DNA polymerase III subunit gamma/tau [Schnuerera sp. xch1]MBZ2175452.1 DNA polymerase III subunit gamma/tau [Schnuerera sp. xch1]